jgi:chromosome segregation ATPase
VADKLGATFAAKVADLEVSKANLSAECDILRKQLVAAQNDSAAAKTELAGVRSEVDTLRKQLNADAKAAARFKAESEKLAHEFYRLTGTKLVA